MEGMLRDRQRENNSNMSNSIMNYRTLQHSRANTTRGLGGKTFTMAAPRSNPVSSFIQACCKHNHVQVMVRIKHRYLLIHILYPNPVNTNVKNPSKSLGKALPDLVQFHRPSPDELTSQLLVRTIRDQVLLLYGDYGLGLVSSGLSSSFDAL